MNDKMEASAGLVTPQRFHSSETLLLRSGAKLPCFELIYESYGELNAARSNGILICHALSGDHHVAGYHDSKEQRPGWWDNIIGPGKAIDTCRFFVVCPNNLGGCGGSTGPLTPNPVSGRPYGPDFPIVTVSDWVDSQYLLMRHLGIDRWAAVIGGSLGGMQSLEWAIRKPGHLQAAFIIAAAPKLSSQNIAFNEVARQAIRSDPEFHGGRYLDHDGSPARGLMLARMLGHITYLSDDVLAQKFGRALQDEELKFGYGVEFQVESYLRYKGLSFVRHFDANTYLLFTKVLDYFDPAAATNGALAAAMAPARANFYVLSFSSDWRFAPARSREITRALLDADKQVTTLEVQSEQGHDSFLMPIPVYHRFMRTALERLHAALPN